ncbi:IPT/TIG domain-containing protein [Luteitalea sp.]|uniref:IPT/TIG domain-containing protein n=1 Tax=Luteitalea sp. TaxID=2004800 RepID=UPI0025BEB8E9|nr:IPT/TIG domain-containing protein [Luteitalea sp.]
MWAGVNLTAGSSAGAFRGELGLEGTLNGAANSRVDIPTALPAPTMTSLTPASGGVGTSVTIAGTHFRDQQLGSVVTFSTNRTATVTSWSNTSIVATVPASTITGAVRVTVAGTNSTTATFTVAAPPTITALSPTSGGVGAAITLTGTGFGATLGTSIVRFNGVTATTTAWTATSVTAVVPVGATTGPVVVTVNGQNSAGAAFTVIPPPTLTSLAPSTGTVGAVVTLTGTNFGATPGTSVVSFNGTVATPTAWSATSMTAPVPVGAASGAVTVIVSGQTSNGLAFTVIPPPTLTSLTPSTGAVGTVVTLTGTNFGATPSTSVVSFNGTVATPTAWSATSITAPVPVGAASGPVTVTVSGQTSNGLAFTVIPPPTLTSLTPSTGAVGTVVTLTGTDFGAAQGASVVAFNGTVATPTAWSATSITAPVPAGATSGAVTVIVAGQASNGVTFAVVPPTTTIAITLTEPFPGTTFNAPASVALAATTTGGAIARVEFYDGPLLIGTDSAAPYAVTWTSPLEGPHTLIAVAVDQTNAVTPSDAIPITIAPAGTTLGTLAMPVPTPPAGVYGPGQTVTLTAAQGATIRYTLDSSTPDTTSSAYSGPVTLTASATLKALAMQAGWTDSALLTAEYVIDTVGPTIVATLTPTPNLNGWNTSPVTVSFACADASPVATCPAPVVVSQEGAGQVVNVTATDSLGNQSSSAVTVNIDLTFPSIVMTNPAGQMTTTAASLNLTGTAADTLSGLSSVLCNGVWTTPAGNQVECAIDLQPGVNTVTISGVDMAGNSTSAAVTVTRQGTPTMLSISPAAPTLAVGESRTLTAVSEFGPVANGVIWTQDPPGIATLTADAEPTLVAVAPGVVTLTATAGTVTATTTVTVANGPLTVGTPVWNVAPTPGTVAGAPIYPNRVYEDGADLFAVETNVLSQTTRVHALDAHGRVLWSEHAAGEPLFGDAFGGILGLVRYPETPTVSSIVRFGGGRRCSVALRLGRLDR